MKKSYKRLIIFDAIVAIILLLNSFMSSILRNYWYMTLFLVILLVLFKYIFGFEKDRHRYIKDIILNMLIIMMISFIIYYVFGLFISFARTENFLNFYGLKTFVLPYVIMLILREYLRSQMINKAEKSKWLIVITCILFILIDFANAFSFSSINTAYNTFVFIAIILLPIISNNIVCTYIAMKVGPKPNMFWILIAMLYKVFLPIVPNVGIYLEALIGFLFPYVIMYDVHSFFAKREKDIPISYVKKRVYFEIPLLALFVFTLAYFVSGFFRYYAIAVATGSMVPNIYVGDVVIVDQHIDYKNLEIGEIIAYKYDNIVVVHRLYDIVIIKDEYYFYTKGDANNAMDNYIIYPDTIIGKVKTKVPYIGLPTVWLSKLFE